VSSLVDKLLHVPAGVVYAVTFALVFAEDALFVGFVLPGETAAILAGVAANQGNANLFVAIIVVVAAAILGDSVGYEVGRIFGRRLFHLRPLRRHEHRLDDANRFLAKWGGWAVFFGRFTAFFRAVMPALAGAALMPYRRFLFFNALGGIVWGTGCVLLGYLAGGSYHAIEKYVGRGAAGLAGVVVIGLLVVWRVRKSRAERAEESRYAAEREGA
jgi:membrane protein DedA with SNARE-associated domain